MKLESVWPEQSFDCEGWRGEMASRIAAFDWSDTAMGPIDRWSKSLRATVQLLLASPVPLVMLWGRAGTMIYNDAYAGFAGGRHPFLLGKPVEEGWPEIAAFNRNVVDTCLSGATLSYADKRLTLHRNGQPEDVWMDLHYSPVAEDDGHPAGVIAVVVETTRKVLAEDKLLKLTQTLERRVAEAVAARVEAEERFRQVQKLEAIGNLTGGVAHDFNNVLQIISANLQLIELATRDKPELTRRLHVMSEAVARGGKLAAQMLAFARRQPLNPAVVNPAKLVADMCEFLQRALPESIKLKTSVSYDAWNLFVDRHQLENALLNLVINSRDAIAQGGNILLEVENATLGDANTAGLALPAGDYVRLAVTDDGAGMPDSVKARMFEPFYSTKAEGQGTGLGLSMVFGFVSQSAGCVDVKTKVGEGTTVALYFPRCTQSESQDLDGARPGASRGGETVLVVEDDADVRLSTIDMLAQLGYKVLSAEDADAALAVLRKNPKVDLLFSDVVMPGTIRADALAKIASAPPYNAAVVFASGYTRDIIFHEGRLDEGVVLLKKPFTFDDLARTVRNALDTRH
ncbi:PAS/PAC sensor hybrid histidine kinase [Caballeronia fortuita]|uniref:histidine kinase n=1 Tax=Caballeronia fortuita TaxID=1777138 RepID=A0A158AK04_9BURK|nr:ATP-binding protein [Caballeronia fortuita]SAK58168.1 PAS/PAC sensor hybrid histidine kinase [Caballeronia fortuita]